MSLKNGPPAGALAVAHEHPRADAGAAGAAGEAVNLVLDHPPAHVVELGRGRAVGEAEDVAAFDGAGVAGEVGRLLGVGEDRAAQVGDEPPLARAAVHVGRQRRHVDVVVVTADGVVLDRAVVAGDRVVAFDEDPAVRRRRPCRRWRSWSRAPARSASSGWSSSTGPASPGSCIGSRRCRRGGCVLLRAPPPDDGELQVAAVVDDVGRLARGGGAGGDAEGEQPARFERFEHRAVERGKSAATAA